MGYLTDNKPFDCGADQDPGILTEFYHYYRIVQNKSPRTPVIELYRNFNTLPLPQLHQFQLLCLVHKYLHCRSQLPIVFSKYFTLNKDIHHYNTRSTENLHLARVNTARDYLPTLCHVFRQTK